uniref:Uncharacterized protein n=1 Tax=Plectus sambesii TaxID=2011161 RepID=A0A914VPU8_9BILA
MSTSMLSENQPSSGVFDVIPTSSEYAYISPPDEMTTSMSASQYLECISNSINDSRIDHDATPVTEEAYYDPLSSSVMGDSVTGPTMKSTAGASSVMSPDTAATWGDFSLDDMGLSRSYHVGSISARTH